MIPLLVLRPEPGAAATAACARALGLDAITAPLFTIEPLAWAPPPADAFDAVMLTSANAVRHAGPALATYRGLPAFAVGEATAAAARAAGFARVHAARGDAADLVAMLADARIGRALHLCGAERREAAHPAVRVERIAVYRAVPVTSLPAELLDVCLNRHPGPVPGSTVPQEQAPLDAHHGGPRNKSGVTEGILHGHECAPPLLRYRAEHPGAVALLHSPRAASIFAALVPEVQRGRIALAAISPAAAAVAGPGWGTIAIAPAPTDAALLAVAARLCEDGG